MKLLKWESKYFQIYEHPEYLTVKVKDEMLYGFDEYINSTLTREFTRPIAHRYLPNVKKFLGENQDWFVARFLDRAEAELKEKTKEMKMLKDCITNVRSA